MGQKSSKIAEPKPEQSTQSPRFSSEKFPKRYKRDRSPQEINQKNLDDNNNFFRGILKRVSNRKKKKSKVPNRIKVQHPTTLNHSHQDNHQKLTQVQIPENSQKSDKISFNLPSLTAEQPQLLEHSALVFDQMSVEDHSKSISLNLDNASISTLKSGKLNSPRSINHKNGEYFKDLLNTKIKLLTSKIASCEEMLKKETPSEDAVGAINTAIGLGRLLLSNKFKQFAELIDINLGLKPPTEGEPVPTDTDLHGFWEMTLIGSDDVDDKFNIVEKWKNNEWKEPPKSPPTSRPTSAATTITKNPPQSSSSSRTPTPSKKAQQARNSSSALRDQIRKARLEKMKTLKSEKEKITISNASGDTKAMSTDILKVNEVLCAAGDQ